MPVVALEQKAQILPRLLAQRDYSPLILVLDSLAQPAGRLIGEFVHHAPKDARLIHIRLEHHPGHKRTAPAAALEEIQAQLGPARPAGVAGATKTLLIIDNLGLVPNPGQALQQIMRPGVSVLGVLHTDIAPHAPPAYAPSAQALLEYMATTILRPQPPVEAAARAVEDPLARFDFIGFNPPTFDVHVTHRRRTGREISGLFTVDSRAHTSVFVAAAAAVDEESPDLIEGLTTFRLGASDKARRDREQVALPFLDAQELGDGGAQGGAIIYEFEKDDDYDEEDPYEDPF